MQKLLEQRGHSSSEEDAHNTLLIVLSSRDPVTNSHYSQRYKMGAKVVFISVYKRGRQVVTLKNNVVEVPVEPKPYKDQYVDGYVLYVLYFFADVNTFLDTMVIGRWCG